jgi:outer membrane autotransporter protein
MGQYRRYGARARVALRSGTTSASLLGIALVFSLAQGAAAQSVDIPLNYTLNTGLNFGGSIPGSVLILTINVGVNGGAAQAYAFDTGSASFLTPNGVFTGGTLLAPNANIETYSGTHTFSGDVYQISASSLKFYAAPGATSGGISLSTSGNYNVGSYTMLDGKPPPAQPFGTAVVGAFGAEPEAITVKNSNGTPVATIGSIFGQTVLPNTTPGYVVSANGQSLAALNGQLGTSIPGGPVAGTPQAIQTVPQSVTSCNPCVTVGLTPALLAQFLPLNTVSSTPNGPPFPNSNAQGYNKFIRFDFTLSSPPGHLPQQLYPQQAVSVDSGFTDFHLYTSPTSYPNNYPNPVLTIAAHSGGTQETFNVINGNPVFPSPYTLVNSGVADSNFLGIGFFVQNSVLYNLAGQQEGYSPNFVTDANIVTTANSPLLIGANSVPLGLAGVISGPGGISITSGGSATLSGTNTYTGPTTVSAGGQLFVVGPGSIANSAVTANGTFDISGTNTGAPSTSLSGSTPAALGGQAPTNAGVTITSLSGSGQVALGGRALTLTNAGGMFSGTIADGGLSGGTGGGLIINGGSQTLAGTNTYTGQTTIYAGSLLVDGSVTSKVTVNSGGVLGGNGTVGSVNVNPGGALTAGHSTGIGSIRVAGDLLFSPNSEHLFKVGSSADRTNVDGRATLAGAAVASFQPGGFANNYTILSAAGGRTGTYDSFTAIGLPSYVKASLGYSENDVTLNLIAQISQLAGLSQNQAAVGSALDNTFNRGGSLPGGLGSILGLPPSQLTNALDQLSGQSFASEQTVLSNQALYSREAVLARLRQAAYSTSAGPQAVFAYTGPDAISLDGASDPGDPLAYAGSKTSAAASAFAVKAPPVAVPYAPSNGVTFWAQGMGGWGKINGNTNAAGTTGNFAGVLSGADVRLVNSWLVGFALGYTGSSTNISALASSAQVDTGLVAGYAGTSWGAWNLRLGGTYGINSVYMSRQIAFPGFMDHDTARFNAGTGQVFGEVGYGTAVSSAAVEPFGGLAYVHLDTAGFSESGGASALSTSGASQDTGYSSLGVRAAAAYTLCNGMMLIPRASVAWQYAFGDINPVTALAFAGVPGSNFSVTGIPIARNAALIDAGADLRISPQAKVGLYYWGQQASTAHENGLRGTVTWMF